MDKKWLLLTITISVGVGVIIGFFTYQLTGNPVNKPNETIVKNNNLPDRNLATVKEREVKTDNILNQPATTDSAPIVIAPYNQTAASRNLLLNLRKKIANRIIPLIPSPSGRYLPYLINQGRYLCSGGSTFGIYDLNRDKILNIPETINSQLLENNQKIANQIVSTLWLQEKDQKSILIIANPFLCRNSQTGIVKRLPPKAYILSVPDKLTILNSEYIAQKNNQLGFEITYPINQYTPQPTTAPEFKGGIFALRLYQNPPPIEFGTEFWVVVFDKSEGQTNARLEDFIKGLDIGLKVVKPVKLGKNSCFSAQESQYSDDLGIEIGNSYYFCEANNKVYMMRFRTLQDNAVENKIAQSIKFFPPKN